MLDFRILKQQIPGVKRDVPLKKHTTFRIGGPAKYFFVEKEFQFGLKYGIIDICTTGLWTKKHSKRQIPRGIRFGG